MRLETDRCKDYRCWERRGRSVRTGDELCGEALLLCSLVIEKRQHSDHSSLYYVYLYTIPPVCGVPVAVFPAQVICLHALENKFRVMFKHES